MVWDREFSEMHRAGQVNPLQPNISYLTPENIWVNSLSASVALI